nr:protein kinase [Kibdelosporangium sp. MJ126-NF4]CEL20987.1 serine/threonine protein kinase [Kibdelosporangium sp. MJ126-NF4]CTQ95499.1 serine/threonine protein kinase [Kibdelosporangium sp. MJ126-NF4]
MTFPDRGRIAVVHATATTSGEGVAEKTFDRAFDSRTLSVIKHEHAILTRLAHEVPVLPTTLPELRGGKHVVRMELCTDSLAARVRRSGALEVNEVLELGYSLAFALAAAHKNGVLHGGVSPNNVLFRRSGQPVLADFGVAIREAIPPRDRLRGIEWISPAALQSGVLDERADVYGLGAVLHFALTGDSPHPKRAGETEPERVLRVIGDPVPAIHRPDMTAGLPTMVARMLARHATQGSDKATWALGSVAELLSRPVPRLPNAGPGRRRGVRYRATAAAAAAAIVVGAAAWQWWPKTDTAVTPLPSPVTLDLAEPVDQGSQIVLTWASSQTLDVMVLVMPDGGGTNYVRADRETTIKVPVDPARKYCFRVRGTSASAAQIYESRPKPVRGAVCP